MLMGNCGCLGVGLIRLGGRSGVYFNKISQGSGGEKKRWAPFEAAPTSPDIHSSRVPAAFLLRVFRGALGLS